MASAKTKATKAKLKADKQADRKSNPLDSKLKHAKAGEIGAGLVITVLMQAEGTFGNFAGEWTPTVYIGAVIAAGSVIGYVKRDPLRVPKLVKQWATRDES